MSNQQDDMKLTHPTIPDYHRTWFNDFRRLIIEAETVGDIVKAQKLIGSSQGFYSDFTPEMHAKIKRAEECLDSL